MPKKAALAAFAVNSSRRPWPAFLVMLLASSCGFAYKPVVAHTNKNKIIYTLPLESHTLDISMGVVKRNKDDAEFSVQLKIGGSRVDHGIKFNSLKLRLTGAHPNGQAYDFKQAVIGKEGNWGVVWGTVYNDATITGLDLADGTYYLDYRFIHLTKKDIHHRMRVYIEAGITEDGKTTTLQRSPDFKRFFWVDIAGN